MSQVLGTKLKHPAGYMSCKTCGRVIEKRHADRDGNCSDHQEKAS